MNINYTESINQEPKKLSDSFAIFYFLWMGGASTIAWSAVVNSFDYFDKTFPGRDVTFVFPNAPYVAMLITTLVITHLSNKYSFTGRILVSMSFITATTIFLPIGANLFQDSEFGMSLMMLVLFVMGFNNTLCYASTAGLSSQIGGKYTGYFLIGVAIFGLVMNILKEGVLLILNPVDDADLQSILVYFGITSFLLIISFVFHMMFVKSEFYYVKVKLPRKALDTLSITERDTETALLEGSQKPKRPQRDLRTLLEVGKAAWLYLFILGFSCVQQNIPYPGVMLKKVIPGMENHTKTVSMVTTFSLFYIFGKKIGQVRNIYNANTTIVVLLFRFILAGFFIVQAVNETLPIIKTAWFAYVNIALFGITQGFLNVALFIMGPEQVQGNKKEVAGFLSVFAINFGSMIGGFLALLFKNI